MLAETDAGGPEDAKWSCEAGSGTKSTWKLVGGPEGAKRLTLKTGRTEVQKMPSGALDLAVADVEHLKTWRLELQKMLQGARSRLSATKNIQTAADLQFRMY